MSVIEAVTAIIPMVYHRKVRFMTRTTLKSMTRRPSVVIAGLTILAVLGFLAVNHLVKRFHGQQQALARHLYQKGLVDQKAGKPELASADFRAALGYDQDNFEYQMGLARALRDTGRTDEAEAYLISLWEHSPQNGTVNLALARLAARQGSLDKTIQYYHNAIYGIWVSDGDANRLNAWFELVESLLRLNARPQAQAELITLVAELPHRSELQLRAADLFSRAQDYEHALAEYQLVLRVDRGNVQALEGAGDTAFHLARYRDAERYLQEAAKANRQSATAAQLLQITRLVLEADPFSRRLSNAERNRRIRVAFKQAGKNLHDCAGTKGIDLKAQQSPGGLPALEARWLEIKRKLAPLPASSDSEMFNTAMDLVFQIEQETQSECGAPSGIDQALLLLAQNHAGAEQ